MTSSSIGQGLNACTSIIKILLSICFVVKLCAIAHDFLFGPLELATIQPKDDNGKFWSLILSSYVIVMMSIRLLSMDLMHVVYDLLWACNVAMYVAAFGLYTNRPHLVSVAAMSISIDQIMWYVDVFGFTITYFLKKYDPNHYREPRWLIGVAKYLIWPETTWSRRITSIHHLWFMPFCIYTVGIPVKECSHPSQELSAPVSIKSFLLDFTLSCLFVLSIAVVARLFTPFTLKSRDHHMKQKTVYLNINLAYEVWPDVKISLIQYRSPYAVIHIPRLSLIWSGLNLGCSLVLVIISSILGPLSGVLQCMSE